MGYTVGELKAVLDEYGDHVPVIITIEQGERERSFTEFDADYGTPIGGDPGVVLTIVD